MVPGPDYFLDTNVLVYSTLQDFEPEKYRASQEAIGHLQKVKNRLFISTQILREFYAVVTNESFLKIPLTPDQAVKQIEFFNKTFSLLVINTGVMDTLIQLCKEHRITGKKIHDAAIAATVMDNGISHLLTYNKKDFKGFRQIRVVLPSDIA